MKYIIAMLVLSAAYGALAGLKQPDRKPKEQRRVCIYTMREGKDGATEKVPVSCGYPENVRCILIGKELKCYRDATA